MGMRCPLVGRVSPSGPQPPDEARAPLQAVQLMGPRGSAGIQWCLLQPWGRGRQGKSSYPPGGPWPLSPGLCGAPNIHPTSSHPTSSQGLGSQLVSAGPATWMCTHCLALRGLDTATTGGLAGGPSPEAGPSLSGQPSGVSAAVPVFLLPSVLGLGPRLGKAREQEAGWTRLRPGGPQGCQAPLPPVPWACLAHGRSC